MVAVASSAVMPAGAPVVPVEDPEESADRHQVRIGQLGKCRMPLSKISELVQKGYLEDLVAEATRQGRLDTLQQLTTFTPARCWGTSVCTIAAAEGHRDVLRWACAEGCPWDADTFAQVCLSG